MARGLDISIELTPGGPVFHRRFTRFVSELTDLSPVLEEIADVLDRSAAQAFATSGASSGGRWAALSSRYAMWKARHYPGQPILVATGALRASMGSVRNITPKRLEWGTDDRKARYHQGGTSKMPARPIIRLTSKERTLMTKLVHAYLLEAAQGLSGIRGGIR